MNCRACVRVCGGVHHTTRYSFSGSQDTFVRRTSAYFNTSITEIPMSLQRQGAPIARDESHTNDIRQLKDKAQAKVTEQNRAACLAAASKAGVTPLIIVMVWIVTGK